MAVLRSNRLGNVTSSVAGTFTKVYTCPAGTRAIARDVRFAAESGAQADNVTIRLHDSGVNKSLAIGKANVPAFGTFGVACDVVLLPGDWIDFYSPNAGDNLVLSGSILPLES